MAQTVLPRRSSRNARVGSWSSADLDDTSTKASVNSGGENPQDDEEALKWAALENLPTYNRLRTSILTSVDGDKVVTKEVDVRKLRVEERRILTEKLVPVPEEDNEKFLRRIRDRIDKVGVELPTIEVRFENFNIDAKCYVGGRALPTLWNVTRNIFEDVLEFFHLSPTKKASLNILNEVSGIIKPSRMTLLLGPPGSGKTSLLLALAGKLDPSLKTRGSITYNGYALHEFVPRKTSSYISQYDLHLGELTVRETLDFSAECQGVGTRYDMLLELAKREKVAGIIPDTEIDAFMKATAFKGVQGSLQADYIMKILGLDACADILVGDPMRRGISGGQKKRVTTGEMLVGPTRTYFMDDISTGLDSSTTFQIVKCLQEFVHVMEGTILMSLLQPPPETFELFDDIILLSEGLIVYQGPREHVLEFFETCGFRCPERKSIADFLQEVTSRKDQEQYWFDEGKAFRYVPVNEFANRFRNFHAGRKLADELAKPFPKEKTHKAALAFSKYSVSMMALLKTCYARERLLMKRNSFVYIFKDVLLIILAFIGMTVFLRTRLKVETEDGADYLGALFFSLLVVMFNGFAEIAMTIIRLPVFYKQRDLLFYPAFAYAIPMVILKIPQSIIESGIWVTVTYFVIGFAPEPGRFFRMYLVLFLMHQMSSSLFRLIGSLFRSMIISNVGGFSTLLIIFVLGGFVIPREKIPKWWIWAYWISPLAYGETSITINEFGASRWDKPSDTNPQITTGNSILQSRGLYTEPNFYWIGVGALLGFTVLFNILFTIALSYLNPLGKAKAVISKEALARTQANQDEAMDALPEPTGSGSGNTSLARSTSAAEGNETFEVQMHSMHLESHSQAIEQAISVTEAKQGLSLPFQPFSISFKDVNYYVNMPAEMKQQGATEERLQLLRGVTGCVMPGILTALMGVSGAGKTTLMDVLAGRKTSGYIEGDIRISGYPKVQETFARISGYCEQTDIHSPQLTVHESLLFSAWLRLSADIDTLTKKRFVDEVMELVELDILRDALVGVPGISGLSTEQRKRLTIAVELVANPSIIFMDEPTSGLDARAAAIVMRTVRNTVDTGRTVVCTIHQPSIDICEAFDELLLMKPGGQLIYAGPLGIRSRDMIEYFEAIPGVPKIKGNYNPATWMLEVTSDAAEQRLGVDFADIYRKSSLFQRSEKMVDKLSSPSPDAKDLYFPTQYCQSTWGQFVACLWKQNWTFWRSPGYNLVRFTFTFISALMLSTIFWRIGQNIEAEQDIFIIMGAMYGATLFLGINNGSTVQPVVSVERTVFYRERAAGLYSAFPYAISQVVIEFPYILVQTIMYGFITYAMIGFKWVAGKVMWYLFSMFSTFLYFTYYGLMAVSITPNEQAAAIVATSFYGLFNLFCGFIIPRPKIPGWWVWFYWICPTAWTVYGLVTSQFGDNDKIIRINRPPGSSPIDEFLADYFGFHYDFLGVVAAVLVIIPVLFACLFGIFLTKLNFQRR